MREIKEFGADTVYFVHYSKLPEDISATYVHKVVGVGFLINVKTGIIEDIMVTLISDLCKEFLAYLIVGHNIDRDGIDEIIERIDNRFFGYSQKLLWYVSEEYMLDTHNGRRRIRKLTND